MVSTGNKQRLAERLLSVVDVPNLLMELVLLLQNSKVQLQSRCDSFQPSLGYKKSWNKRVLAELILEHEQFILEKEQAADEANSNESQLYGHEFDYISSDSETGGEHEYVK